MKIPEAVGSGGYRLKVLLAGNYELLHQQSMQRFAAMLRRGLEPRDIDVCLMTPPVIFGRAGEKFKRLERWLGYIDNYIIFPFIFRLESRRADVVHVCDHSNAPFLVALGGKPSVVTCHDMLAIRSGLGEIPENETRWSGRLLQRCILRWLRRAKCVVCDSEATRQDFLRLTGEDGSAVSVIYVGFNREFRRLSPEETRGHLSRYQLEGTPFLLHVGGNQWYKNRLGVLKIFSEIANARPDLLLVLAGKALPPQLADYIAQTEILRRRVVVIEAPDDLTVDALYSSATALLFPSFQEGFGWPIVEAQACGCPVFTSNRAPMNEIGGAAARYFDPEDFSGAAKVVLSGLAEVAAMSEEGARNAARFSTKHMIDQYIDLYWKLIGQGERQMAQDRSNIRPGTRKDSV